MNDFIDENYDKFRKFIEPLVKWTHVFEDRMVESALDILYILLYDDDYHQKFYDVGGVASLIKVIGHRKVENLKTARVGL
jgi:hypothetical protein